MEIKCQIHALASFSLQGKTTQYLSYCIGGPIGCPETSITTNLRCVTLQTSEDLSTAVHGIYHEVLEFQSAICRPVTRVTVNTFTPSFTVHSNSRNVHAYPLYHFVFQIG
jgi:hypothetical protein